MNTSPNNTPEPAGGSLSPEALAKADDPGYSSATTRPLYWSARRELWENRSIYIAPLIVAAVVLFGFLVSTIGMPERRRAVLLLDPAKQRALIGQPYDVAAMMLIFTRSSLACSIVSTRCTANVVIAAFCSGNRCRFRISLR